MNIVGVLIILICSIIIVAQAHGVDMDTGRNMLDWGTLLAKATGATLGSGIAVVFKKGGNVFHRFLIGLICGVIFSPTYMDYLHWERTPENWIAASCTCGLIGYLLLQIFYSEESISRIKSVLRREK